MSPAKNTKSYFRSLKTLSVFALTSDKLEKQSWLHPQVPSVYAFERNRAKFFQCSVWILISSIFFMFYPYHRLQSMVTLLIPVVPKLPKFSVGLRFTVMPRRWIFLCMWVNRKVVSSWWHVCCSIKQHTLSNDTLFNAI